MSNSHKILQRPTIYSIYILFFIKFIPFVGTPPQLQNIRGGGARDRQCMWFRTYGHPDFKFYDELFYPIHEYKGVRRKKRVPPKIHELLTPRGLAYWFMDDGTYAKRAHHRIYRFSTHSFPLSDQEILVKVLRDNFGCLMAAGSNSL